jgi:hypothetical protein
MIRAVKNENSNPTPDESLAPKGAKPIVLKAPLKPWQWPKGGDGRNGRPRKSLEIRDLGQRWTPEIMRGLILQSLRLRDTTLSPANVLACTGAAKLVLGYSIGQPTAKMEVTGPGGGPLQVIAVATDLQDTLMMLAKREGITPPANLQALTPPANSNGTGG